MAGSFLSTFMMLFPQQTQWVCLIGLCIFVFGIYIPYEEHKKKKKQTKNRTKQRAPKTPASQKRISAGGLEDKKELEQLKILREAGLLSEEEYQEKKRSLR